MKFVNTISTKVIKNEYYILTALFLSWLAVKMDLPFGAILISICYSIAAFLYAVTAYANVRSESPIDKFMSKLSGIASCISTIGCLYAIMHWPGTEQLLIVGGSSLAITLIFLLMAYAKGNKEINPASIVRVSCIMITSFILMIGF